MCMHEKKVTYMEVAIPIQTLHKAFPLWVTTDWGIRL